MNKNLYRIIFNRARGMLVVVAEIAGSGQGNSSAAGGRGRTLMRMTGRLAALPFALWLSLGSVHFAQAAIVADAGAAGKLRPNVTNSANGTPQVNIQAPSAGGVSRNVYSRFDVDHKGVILNNANKNARTELGGMIAANPNLARGSAKVILNEVNARDPSKLNGYIEVAGQKAQVIIANPAGISCDGCGFINANRATLTTGQALMQNGAITGYDVSRGEIVVQGRGMDASKTDYTDIIARSVKVNAGLWANELNVTTGANRVSADGSSVQARTADDKTRPGFALDVSSLGGMYAGKIRLTGTEKGVGVRNAGEIGASVGNVTLNTDGTISNSGTMNAAKDIQLSSRAAIDNQGTVYAKQDSVVTASGALVNRGTLAAGRSIGLTGASLNNQAGGALAAGMRADGRVGQAGDLTIKTAGKAQSQGQMLSGRHIDIAGNAVDLSGGQNFASGDLRAQARAGDISLVQSKTQAQGAMSLQASGQLNNQGGALQAGALSVTAAAINNAKGGIQAQAMALNARTLNNTDGTVNHTGTNALRLGMAESINNQGGTIASRGSDLSVATGVLNNQRGAILHQDNGRLNIDANTLNGSGGTISSEGALAIHGASLNLDHGQTIARHLSLTGDTLSNRDGKLVQTAADGPMDLNVRGALDNTGGYIASQGGVGLQAGSLTNNQGEMTAVQGPLRIALRDDLHNQGGVLNSGGALTLTARLLDNLRGTLNAAGNLQATVTGVVNTQGVLAAGGALALTSQGMNNNDGALQGNGVTLNLGDSLLNNARGRLLSSGNMALNSGELQNGGGIIQSNGDMALDTRGKTLNNAQPQRSGGILSGGTLTLRSGALNNAGGTLSAGRGLSLAASSLDNGGGTLTGKGALNLHTGALNNNGGLIQGDSLDIDTGNAALSNQNSGTDGGIIASGTLNIRSGALNNQAGAIIGQRVALATQGTPLNNEGGEITGGKALTLDSGALNNRGGKLLSGGELILRSGALDNSAGRVQANGTLNLDTQGARLINAEHGLISGGNLTLRSGNIDNRSGALLGDGGVDIISGGLDNRGGTLGSELGDITLVGSALDNRSGLIQGKGNVALNTNNGALFNGDSGSNGGIFSGGTLIVRSGALDNQRGILSGARVDILAQGLNNTHGLLLAAGDASLDTQGSSLINASTAGDSEGIRAQGTLTISSGDIDNQSGFIGSGRAIVNAGTLNNSGGTFGGNGGLRFSGAGVNNARGRLQSAGDIQIDSKQGLENGGGIALADGTLTITGGAINNAQGQLQGGKGVRLTKLSTVNNQGGKLLSGGDLALNAGSLDNRSGELFAFGDVHLGVTGLLDNSGGTLKANDALVLKAGTLRNSDTRSGARGVEAQSIQLNAGDVDNRRGRIQSAQGLQADVKRQFINDDGLLVSGGALTLQGDALNIANRAGTVYADDTLKLVAALLGGDGSVQGAKDVALTLREALHNTGVLAAGGNLALNSGGQISNDGMLGAGKTLDLKAVALNNGAGGEISAGQTRLNIATILHNLGLIDGGLTYIIANALENLGTGRIYGDHIALQTASLTNDKDAASGKAAVIAARDRLDIGAGTLLNRDHALLYSGGNMSIGGQLNDALNATGQGGTLSNHSAQIEAAGDLSLSMGRVDNRDIHLRLSDTPEEVSRESFDEWQYCQGDKQSVACNGGDGKRYILGPVEPGGKKRYGLNPDGSKNTSVELLLRENHASNRMRFTIPGFGASKHFIEYIYDRIISETKILQRDGASITSGGNMTVTGGALVNQDSRIVAGRDFINRGASLDNRETKGTRTVVDVGKRISYYKKGDWHTARNEMEYQGENASSDLSLGLMRFESHADTGDTGYAVDRRDGVIVDGQGGVVSDRAAPGRDGALSWDDALDMPDLLTGGKVDGVTDRPLEIPPGESITLPLPPEEVDGKPVDKEIRVAAPSTRLPDNSLYHTHPGASSDYLVETDPRFTQEKKWLGSDYMQKALANDPNNLLKRLGDGYYEQTLIRDQITRATGQRYLDGQSSDEAQYRMLMDNGIAFAKKLGLTPGVALSPEQMAQLTSSIVWLVTQQVRLPDGSVEQVLVPQVYLKVNQNSVNGNGALIAGNRVFSETSGDVNNSGTIAGRDVTRLDANNLTNTGFIQGGAVDITSRLDIHNRGGAILGDNSVSLKAGRDLVSESLTRGSDGARDISAPATVWVQNPGGSLTLQGMRDVTLTGSVTGTHGEGSSTTIVAGNNLTLDTVKTSRETSYRRSDKQYDLTRETQEAGSQVSSGGTLTLHAGNDLNARAADVTAGGALSATAGRDVTIESGERTYDHVTNDKWTTSGFLSKTKHETHDELHERTAQGSNFSGDTVQIGAGRDLTVRGSSVAGTGDVLLAAGNNLNITTADEAQHESHMSRKKKSGVMGTGGLGFTVGSAQEKVSQSDDSNLKKGSIVGSSQGNLTLSAGNQLNVHGSDLIAGKDMALSGSDVSITAAENSHTSQRVVEQSNSGLTLSLSGAAGSALNTAISQSRAAKEESSGRLAALEGVQSVLSGVQAGQVIDKDLARGKDDPGNNNTIGVSAGYGSQRSRSESRSEEHYHQGSSLTAGDNLSITATGRQGGGDIRVEGSELQAGRDMALNAKRDVTLTSSADTREMSGKNKSSGGSLGVSVGAGQGGMGLSVSASANSSHGRERGSGVTHNETQLRAGNLVTIESGRDTTLTGAQVSGRQVTADVGRNLTLGSEQDSDRYDSRQSSVSAGGSVAVLGAGGSASVSVSQDKMHSTYDSVQEQTGIFAGSGGFDVKVGGHTQLDGAVIGSTAEAGKNRLDTGTLGWSDIHNRAEYEVSHAGAGMSTGGGNIGNQFVGNAANNMLAGLNSGDSAHSTTRSAVSDGTITVRDVANQKQDTGELNRDVAHANETLSPIFDKEKEQKRLREAQVIGEIGSQTGDIIRTQGEIIATRKARDKMAGATDADRAKAKADWETAHPGKTATDKDIEGQVYENFYKDAFDKTGTGTGSTIQRVVQGATAVVQGLAGGDLRKAIAGGAAPEIANIIGRSGMSSQEKVLAHAVVNVALALAQGNNALSGAAGAAAGEAMGLLSERLYGKSASELTESERATVSALATLAAGLAGGLAGNSAVDAATGAQAGKTTVENNLLGGNEETQTKFVQEHGKDIASCSANPGGAACRRGMAMNDALSVALPAGLGGGVLAAASPEIAVAARAAIEACAGNVVLCLNNAGIQVSEAIVPGGVGAGGAVGIGKTASEAAAAKAEAAAANAAKNGQTINNSSSLNVAEQIGILRDAAKGNKGYFGLGKATANEANVLGEAWVGPGYRISKDGTSWVSADGLRVYRPPSAKPNSTYATTGVQANFEQKLTPGGRPISNGHLDITK